MSSFEINRPTPEEQKYPRVEVDHDTAVVSLPNGRRLTFVLTGISDDFLTSRRTDKDARRYGVGMQWVKPYAITGEMSQDHNQAHADGEPSIPLPLGDVGLARHGFTPTEFGRARNVAYKALLHALRDAKQKSVN